MGALRQKGQDQKGYALASVLIIVAFLSIIALNVAGQNRAGQRVFVQAYERVQARALSEAALVEAVVRLSERNPEKQWLPDGRINTFTYADRKIEVSIFDELGKVDLNTASDDLLLKLLEAVLDDEVQAISLRDGILDWRDEDVKRRPQGAEAANYRHEGQAMLPSNQPFLSVSELNWVKGMTPDLYVCLAPALTVHSHRRNVDPSKAQALVQKALGLESLPEVGRAVSAIRGGLGGRALEVRIAVPLAGGGDYHSSVIIRITEDPKKPYWVLERGRLALACRQHKPSR